MLTWDKPDAGGCVVLSENGYKVGGIRLRFSAGINTQRNCGISSIGGMNYLVDSLKKNDWGGSDYSEVTKIYELIKATDDITISLLNHHFNGGTVAGYLLNDSLFVVNIDQPRHFKTSDFIKFIGRTRFGKLFPGPIMANPFYLKYDNHLIQAFWWVPPASEKFIIRTPAIKTFEHALQTPEEYARGVGGHGNAVMGSFNSFYTGLD
jgi:hypothetical protein